MTSVLENSSNENLLYKIKSWDDEKLDLKQKLLRGIYAFGFENPSSIQSKALYPMTYRPARDIIAQAQSGTGKTGAFVTGTLQIINEKVFKTQAVILAPTHELAIQTKHVLDDIGRFLKIRSQLLVGGTSVEKDKKLLLDNTPQIVIGTPGRVHDMFRRKYLSNKHIKLLVIDEADEMLSSGFTEQMYKIFQYMPNDIQIGLFSATMPDDLQELTEKFLRNPIKILVKAEQLTLQGIAQYFINIEDDVQKYETLKDLFSSLTVSQAIIYCNSTKRVDDLQEAMEADNFPVKKIHGKMPDEERKKTHKDFKSGGCRVLITSDLFARGIDVQQVSIVINFDIPKNEHTYLHRIGRSGRWGRKGIAINFQSKFDATRLKKFEDYYCTQIEEMPANYTEHLGLN
jgi:translation initiation factor 4A|tara:strand:+ start:10340 stop:11539 length:1200 start_codon:yes stop_codon:yes gene_type:complete